MKEIINLDERHAASQAKHPVAAEQSVVFSAVRLAPERCHHLEITIPNRLGSLGVSLSKQAALAGAGNRLK
jgi:hypothetical protein